MFSSVFLGRAASLGREETKDSHASATEGQSSVLFHSRLFSIFLDYVFCGSFLLVMYSKFLVVSKTFYLNVYQQVTELSRFKDLPDEVPLPLVIGTKVTGWFFQIIISIHFYPFEILGGLPNPSAFLCIFSKG